MLASIPSPPDNAIHLGPFELRAYGLAIAAGVLAAVAIAQRRWARRGGDPADISAIAVWAVLAGIVGARAYHVATDWRRFEGRWSHVVAIWEGGLGVPGGLLAGVLVGVWLAHRRGLPVARLLDVVAPAIPVAQAIGRLGNWFNQELFGRPTNLPWGLEIDPEQRPARYAANSTFHPTFLYEALWNLALAGLLVLYERRRPEGRPGRLFALYVGGYAIGRMWIEALRVDPASELIGVRVNIWTSAVAVVGAAVWLLVVGRRPVPAEPEEHAADTAAVAAGSSTDAEAVPAESGAEAEAVPAESGAHTADTADTDDTDDTDDAEGSPSTEGAAEGRDLGGDEPVEQRPGERRGADTGD